jgi:hypothetical protein
VANPIPFQAIWTDYFGQIIDYHDYGMLFDQIRSAVLAGPWYGVYDLIQWLVQNTHTHQMTTGDTDHRHMTSTGFWPGTAPITDSLIGTSFRYRMRPS